MLPKYDNKNQDARCRNKHCVYNNFFKHVCLKKDVDLANCKSRKT